MIISRTPYRISFFGGGTDYHTWYQEFGSSVLATTINHYCYLTCRPLAPFFSHKTQVVWSTVEQVLDHSEIQHPAVREALAYLNIDQGVEIHHQGDLPARSGLGSSSAFTVGLLNALYAMQGVMSSKKQLASEAVYIERERLKENVGVQDQIQTAHGGFNHIRIERNGEFHVEPLILPQNRLTELQNHLLLFFTGVVRHASEVAGEKMKSLLQKQNELNAMQSMVAEAIDILTSGSDIRSFGRLLHESWLLKRSLTSSISPDFVDRIYVRARQAGAIGGKLLGAGGGGFMLFFARPEDHPSIMHALSDLLRVPFQFEPGGSQIIFYDPSSYSATALRRRDFMHLQPQALQEKQRSRRMSVALETTE